MRAAISSMQWLVRITGAIQLVLGGLFWTGSALRLIPAHMLSGIILVLALWTLALLGARAGVASGFVALALVWGLVVVAVGYSQAGILPGPAHWIVQILHLLLGLGAIGQAENLARRGKLLRPTARVARAA